MFKPVILCVDDTPANLEVLVELLHEYEVVVSLEPLNALTLLQRIKVDMILLDIMMPVMDGFELCRKIKSNEHWRDIPILFITAKNDEESIAKGYALGGIDYVTKPFRPKELLSRVSVHLKLHTLIENLNDEVEKILQKQRQQEHLLLTQSYAASMGRMIDLIAHQWMQPLQVVNMRLGKLMLDYEDGRVDEDYLQELHERGVSQIHHLVDTLNVFRSFMSPYQKYQSLRMSDVVDHALLLLKELLASKQLEVKFVIEKDFELIAIENEWVHVFINLLQNSINAYDRCTTSKQRHIQILINGYQRQIHISDEAGGIPKNLLTTLFDLHVSKNIKHGGSGVGLYLCRMIAEKYNVIMTVKNVNGGANFTLDF